MSASINSLLFETKLPEAAVWESPKAGFWQERQDGMGSSYYWEAIQAAKQNNPVLLTVPWICPSDLQLLLQKDTDLRTEALSYM